MKKLLSFGALALVAILGLASCGGGGNTITDPDGGGGSPEAAVVQVVSSATQLNSDVSNAESVEITAVVKDANNVLLPDAPVTFSATNNGSLAVASATTDENGRATARLSNGSDLSLRTITVGVTSGTASGTVSVAVVNTAVTINCPAETLSLGATDTCNVIVKDSKGAGIAGVPVAVVSSSGNTLSSASLTTGVGGGVSLTLTATQAGADNITASALGAQGVDTVTVPGVAGNNFTITTPASDGANVPLGTSQQITATWTVSGVPQNGQTITFTSTRGTLSSATATTVGGQASVTVSSTTAGIATITASTPTGLQATRQLEFVATQPATVDLQAEPFTVRTSAQSQLTAVVRDAIGNLVKNQVVSFQIVTDPTGGSLAVAQGTTDSQGRVVSAYTAGLVSSAVNGVRIRATVLGTSPVVSDDVTLTVAGQALAISLGTGNELFEPTSATFAKEWVIFVTDADGNAVPNKPVQVSIRSVNYRKGELVLGSCGGDDCWVKARPPLTPAEGAEQICVDEDAGVGPDATGALNGILDSIDLDDSGTIEPNETEDFNGSGLLEAGNIALVAAVPANAPSNNPCGSAGSQGQAATVTTGNAGTARVCVFYPQNYNLWLDVRIAAKASVAGTEFSKSQTFQLDALATDINNTDASPPGQVSPFGLGTCDVPPPP